MKVRRGQPWCFSKCSNSVLAWQFYLNKCQCLKHFFYCRFTQSSGGCRNDLCWCLEQNMSEHLACWNPVFRHCRDLSRRRSFSQLFLTPWKIATIQKRSTATLPCSVVFPCSTVSKFGCTVPLDSLSTQDVWFVACLGIGSFFCCLSIVYSLCVWIISWFVEQLKLCVACPCLICKIFVTYLVVLSSIVAYLWIVAQLILFVNSFFLCGWFVFCWHVTLNLESIWTAIPVD